MYQAKIPYDLSRASLPMMIRVRGLYTVEGSPRGSCRHLFFRGCLSVAAAREEVAEASLSLLGDGNEMLACGLVLRR